jgi:hypothetical protein
VVEDDGPWSGSHIVLALHGGAGSAVGFFGGTVAYSPIPFLETEVGVGKGLYGTYLSVMQKITVGGPTTHFVSGVGLAYSTDRLPYSESPAWWLNLDLVGFESRFRNHFAILLAGGLTVASEYLNPFNGDCYADHDCQDKRTFPQMRLGLGAWF